MLSSQELMARWLHALVALITLSALAFAGRGYLYCHMAGQAMTSCCCGGAGQEASQESSSGFVSEPCCERRGGDVATAATAVRLPEGQRQPLAPSTLAVSSPLPRVASAPHSQRVAALLVPRAPPLARGSPSRRGKARARLGVMIC
jgi:hypothetical protein